MLGGPLETISNFIGALLMEILKFGFAGERRVHRAQQPVEVEMVSSARPLPQFGLHRVARLGPVSANLSQRQITLRKLCAATIHPIENIHDDIQGLVRSGDFLGVKLHIRDGE